jgi:SAM-dependent methyltransferase
MPSFYDRHILPHVIGCACATRPIMKQRAKIVPRASGRVLEVGVGGGLNLGFYDLATVDQVDGVDPSDGLLARAAERRPAGLDLRLHRGAAEALPFDDASFDCVVCTYTLCSVASPATALAEARRVLRPGGQFLFSEHGLSPDANVVRWQHRLEPIWRAVAGGCHLTRPVASAVAAAGFSVEVLGQMYVPGTLKAISWSEWGIGRPS